MESLPFTIQKFVDLPDGSVDIVPIGTAAASAAKVPGYFVMSSAPPNIDSPEAKEPDPEKQAEAVYGIDEMAKHLYRMLNSGKGQCAELVITVHGYNTSRSSVEAWYKNIFNYINRHDETISERGDRLFIGYRWPSESVGLTKFEEVKGAFQALPPLPRDLLILGGLGALLLGVFELYDFNESWWGLLIGLGLVFLSVVGTLMLALVLMRLVVYFRDRYRADNFGVLDLVELLRQIDQALIKCTVAEQYPHLTEDSPEEHINQAYEQARSYWSRRSQSRIKLSFIGHSMGAFVVTNVVRILSDVFDSQSINKQPTPDIGDVFRLGRLILASPDIPVMTIISTRANFLASSLRRFSESYLFSSEGDIALRIASTAANYIAFPSKSQARGYRLGNVALQNRYQSDHDYGLINLPVLDQEFSKELPIGKAIAQLPHQVLENLFLTTERSRKRVVTLADLFEAHANVDGDRVTVADFFTYFDCTDYCDVKYDLKTGQYSSQSTGLLTRAQKKTALTPWDYLLLTLDYATSKRNVHGGYFEGQFSRILLYRLAFLGFDGYLNTLDTDAQAALSQLHLQCREKKIQGFLSPLRYRVSIQGQSQEDTKQELLEAIQTEEVQDLKAVKVE